MLSFYKIFLDCKNILKIDFSVKRNYLTLEILLNIYYFAVAESISEPIFMAIVRYQNQLELF